MKAALRDQGLLVDIETTIHRIHRHTAGMSLEDFLSSELVQDAVIRNVAIIGEAASRLSDATTEAHPEIPWRNIAGMRNRLVHDYNGVNLKLVWNTIQNVMPGFLAAVQVILAELSAHSGDRQD